MNVTSDQIVAIMMELADLRLQRDMVISRLQVLEEENQRLKEEVGRE